MKVAILGPVYTDSYFGGVATFDENLAYGFKCLGHDITVYSNQKNRPTKTRYGIEIKKISTTITEKYDVVITSLSYVRYIYRFQDAKKIFFLHGFYYMPTHGMIKTFAALAFQKYFIRKCDYVIANSEFTRFFNYQAYDIHSNGSVKLGVSYEFIEKLQKLKQSNVERVPHSILYTGRLIRPKCIDQVLRALKMLNEKGEYDYHLTIVGDGDLQEELLDFSTRNNLKVDFVGKVSQEEIVKYYLSNEIFISMNAAEPFGITYCEALLGGCKVICPKTGGQVEFLANYSDRTKMVNGEHPEEIANAITELYDIQNIEPIDINDFLFSDTAKQIISMISDD